MTRPEFLSFIAATIKKKGGIEKASGSWDIQCGNLRAVCEGRIQPGPRLQKHLGITKTVSGEWVQTRRSANG